MALQDISLNIHEGRLPRHVDVLVDEANHRIHSFIADRSIRISSFVPSDFEPAWFALQAIVDNDLATGTSFCEWGSGFGVVALMAALLEFESCGIEIEHSLVDASRSLADEFDLNVDFVRGSFIPAGGEPIVAALSANEDAWLIPVSDSAYDQLGLSVSDFDVVYAFPWPGEEKVIAALFDEFASVGALLMTFDHIEGVRIRRKVVKRSRG